MPSPECARPGRSNFQTITNIRIFNPCDPQIKAPIHSFHKSQYLSHAASADNSCLAKEKPAKSTFPENSIIHFRSNLLFYLA